MKKALCVIAFALALAPTLASAQTPPSPAVQALSACMTRSMTSEDNIVLARWIFVAIARHPSVLQLTNISDAQRVEANRQMGALFNKLVIESCPNETRAAFRSDGEHAIEAPFGTLGETAMTDIMGNADVNAGVLQMGAYIDQQRLNALVQPQR